MKQIINKLLNKKEQENNNKDAATDKVLTSRQLDGLRQAYILERQEVDLEEDMELSKEVALWTTKVRKGGD